MSDQIVEVELRWHMDEVQLETDRLLLRMWREEDFEPYAKMCEDEDIMRFIGGKRSVAWKPGGTLLISSDTGICLAMATGQ